jgi:hypothetical protein
MKLTLAIMDGEENHNTMKLTMATVDSEEDRVHHEANILVGGQRGRPGTP